MVSTSGPGLRPGAAPATTTRWDLKDDSLFPQWKVDLDRLIRAETSELFIESSRPTIANLMETDQGDRSSRSTAASTLKDAKAALEQWDAWNARVFDIVKGSVTLSKEEINEYQSLFAKGRLGQDFYD